MSDREEEKKYSKANSIDEEEEEDNTKFAGKNTLDEGIIAFGEWLNSAEDLSARCGPLSLRKIANYDDGDGDNNREILLFDAALGKEVTVKMIGGVPVCSACQDDTECMHIGFSICVAQMNRRNAI